MSADGNVLVNKGLKTMWTENTKSTAMSLLTKTDWYVVRKSENSTAIPAKITAYRTAVRLVCNSLCTAIDDASDVDAIAALYLNASGVSDAITVDGSSTSVVNTSSNSITSNAHGLSNDELVTYDSGVDGSGNAQNPITGLVSGNRYYVISKTTNTFKLSHTNSHMGDAAVISLTGVGGGASHKFTSDGIPPLGQSFPRLDNPSYKV